MTGGECGPIQGLDGAEYMIACDRGLRYALDSELVPDIVIGDFDSLEDQEALDQFRNVVRYPKEKDDTDTMLAIKHAISLGFSNIQIFGAFGGRMDHFIANIQAAAYAAAHGALCRMTGRDEEAWVFSGRTVSIPKKSGWSFSLFALTDICSGVTLTDMKYPAENVTVTNTFPIGISNEYLADTTDVSVKEGILLVMQSRMD